MARKKTPAKRKTKKSPHELLLESTRAPQNKPVKMDYDEMNEHVKEQLGFMVPRVVEAMILPPDTAL